MKFLCAKISKSSGDIRVVFDIMKSAFQKLMNRVQKIGNCDFENNYKTLIPKLNISKSMMIDVFEDKKGVKLSDTLKSLPA